MDLREIALYWYSLLGAANAAAGGSLIGLSTDVRLPMVGALLLGLLGATSPCQLTTNLSALALTSGRLGASRAAWRGVLAYLLGKALVYTLIGTAVVLAGRELATGGIPAFVAARKALGPLMILAGLFLLRLVPLGPSIGLNLSYRIQNRVDGAGAGGTFLMGSAFALAFCPTLFWLFFGVMVPMAAASPVGLLYPSAFAMGTILPLLVVAGLLSLGIKQATTLLPGLKRFSGAIQQAAGLLLVLSGINDVFLYWLL